MTGPLPRIASLIDLGFGDGGKGLFVDALARRGGATLVVRFNGGAQAGHNVVLPDGRHHTFSQFGAASFVPGVRTLLAEPVVVHPGALAVEARVLEQRGLPDALKRLAIDSRCRLTTPWHQSAGRLREWARGDRAHGSCGIGFGETVQQGLAHPAEALQWGDLLRPATAMAKMQGLRERLAAEWSGAAAAHAVLRDHEGARAEVALLADPGLAERWLVEAHALALQVQTLQPEQAAQWLQQREPMLFEGAQGLLLDEWCGLHPHTSWSSVGPAGVNRLLREAGVSEPCHHIGVLRSYLTRHGAGPMPTEDAALDGLREPHNTDSGWQGRFRRGHPDAVLLRHAADHAAGLGELAVSHLDAFDAVAEGAVPPLRWCEAYGFEDGLQRDRLPRLGGQDLAQQAALTRLVAAASPRYEPGGMRRADELLARMEAASGLRVGWTGAGPTHATVVRRSG